jgi:hypothetical protein
MPEPPAIPPETLARIRHLIESHPWRFAKTMPENPHFYTLRKQWASDSDFVMVVEAIRKYGEREMFRGWPYTVLVIDGWKYWTMGAPMPATILINRKALSPADEGTPARE